MAIYVVEPTTGGASYQVEAESASYDNQTGAILFKNGDELVARVLNASFRKKASDAASTDEL